MYYAKKAFFALTRRRKFTQNKENRDRNTTFVSQLYSVLSTRLYLVTNFLATTQYEILNFLCVKKI